MELSRRDGRPYLGGSDVAVVCGLGFAAPQALWEVKVGQVSRQSSFTTATQHGVTLEPAVRQWYRDNQAFDEAGKSLEVTRNLSFRRHADPALSYLGAIPDGLVHTAATRTSGAGKQTEPMCERKRLLEIKCPAFRQPDDHRNPLPDYVAQIQAELEIWDLNECDLVVYYQTSRVLKIWRVYRNKFFFSWMRKRTDIFWEHVVSGIPPRRSDLPWLRPAGADLRDASPNLIPRVFCTLLTVEENVDIRAPSFEAVKLDQAIRATAVALFTLALLIFSLTK